ncbi:MAG: PAS domain S-box protein [Desulfomonile tiedjei]|nr:PAS domain S-box protein [Desulfomonile tiedjei]
MAKARILVVEDEGIIAEDLQMSLRDHGYNVFAVVTTGEEAVRIAGESRPDLVIMDVVLHGEMDGIEAANRIRSRLGVPVIYLTAYADDKMIERAKITEPFGYLIKPFRDRELYSTIELALFKHQLDTRLRESQEWLSVTLNSIGDALIATDRQGLVKYANPVAQTLTGWREYEAKGRPLKEVFNSTIDPGLQVHCSARNDDPAVQPEDFPLNNQTGILISKDGSKMAIDAGAAPICDARGAIVGVVIVFRDITERKRVEERLRLLSETVEQSSEGLAVISPEARVVFVNKAFAAMHGRVPEDLIGKNISVFHNPDQIPDVREANRKLLTEGYFSGEMWHAREDGTVFPGLMHNSVLRDNGGKMIGLIATLRDITDLKETQEALLKSHQELETYSSSLEAKVEERTKDLERSRIELKKYSESLEKTNEALRIIIEGIEEQKKEVEKRIVHNINLTVRPILDQLKSQDISETVGFLLQSLEFNLTNIFSSFGFNIMQGGHLLTPREIRICEMIRSGLSSKQIAKVMGISPQTVLVHRKNVRKKLALGKSRRNLASFLKANL